MKELFEQAQNDPELQITPEAFEAWIKEQQSDDMQNHYLENKTPQMLTDEVRNVINAMECIPFETKMEYIERLQGWRFVEDLRDFQRGRYIRHIHKTTGKITKLMVSLDIKFTKNGTTIMSRFMRGGPIAIQYSFDNYYTFQKIIAEEHLILMANEHMGSTLLSETNIQTPVVPEAIVPEAIVPEAIVPEAVVPETVVPEIIQTPVVPETVVPEIIKVPPPTEKNTEEDTEEDTEYITETITQPYPQENTPTLSMQMFNGFHFV